jgi:excisionase family DNA binding protein
MARHLPAGVHLTAAECAKLDGLLVRGLRDLRLRDGTAPPDLLEIVAPIHQAAAEFRASVLVEPATVLVSPGFSPGSGTGRDSSGSAARSSIATERLSVQQAARFANVSESYLRRLARMGALRGARPGGRGGWTLDGGSVAAWAADRNETRKAG